MAGVAHARRLQPDLELDVDGAVRRGWPANRGRAAAAGRPRAACTGTRNGASASSVTIHGESVLAKFFDRKGPSGWYSQPWMSRALQSLKQREAEDVAPRPRRSAMRLAERVGPADEDAELELVVEPAARAERRRVGVGRLGLAERAAERLARWRPDRRGPAVVADRHPLVVGQQRVVGAELPADRGGVVDAGVEVGVVADVAGQAASRRRPAARSAAAQARLAALPRAQARRRARGAAPRRALGAARHQAVHVGIGRRAPAARRSSTWSPMATPMRQARRAAPRRKRPNGRFWIGKSVAGSSADATQLCSAGSCVVDPVRRRVAAWPLRVEVLAQALPAAAVVGLQLGGVERVGASGAARAGLEHEGHGVGDHVGLRQVGAARLLEGLGVGAVAAHAVVQARAAGHEALRPWRRRRRASGP